MAQAPITDATAKFYWGDADSAALQKFLNDNSQRSLDHNMQRRRDAALYLLRKMNAAATPASSPATVQPVPSHPAPAPLHPNQHLPVQQGSTLAIPGMAAQFQNAYNNLLQQGQNHINGLAHKTPKITPNVIALLHNAKCGTRIPSIKIPKLDEQRALFYWGEETDIDKLVSHLEDNRAGSLTDIAEKKYFGALFLLNMLAPDRVPGPPEPQTRWNGIKWNAKGKDNHTFPGLVYAVVEAVQVPAKIRLKNATGIQVWFSTTNTVAMGGTKPPHTLPEEIHVELDGIGFDSEDENEWVYNINGQTDQHAFDNFIHFLEPNGVEYSPKLRALVLSGVP